MVSKGYNYRRIDFDAVNLYSMFQKSVLKFTKDFQVKLQM